MEQNSSLEVNSRSNTYKFNTFHARTRLLHIERFELFEGDINLLFALPTFMYLLYIYDTFKALYSFLISPMHEKLISFKY